MSDTLTYPFLLEFYKRGKTHISPGSMDWIVSQCRAAAGGKAYPANQPLVADDEHAIEGITDKQAYVRVFNACARLLGHDLADQVAREAVGTAVAVQSETEPDDLAITEADLDGLTVDQAALFAWGMGHVQEIYGPDKQPPDYVPKAKRRKWSAMFNSMLKSGVPESVIFGVVNKKYVKGK